MDAIATIEQNPGVTLKDVKAQEAAYERLRQHFSEKYQRLANLGAALYYDVQIGEDVWRSLADYALDKNGEQEQAQTQAAQFESWLAAGNALAQKKGFFHWELEFPNIFFDNSGQPLGERAGFDVVIGNPPYVRQEQLSADKPFFQDRYDVYHGVADLFVYFFAQGLRLLRNDGRLAYISSNTWLYANYGMPLRQYLRTKTTVETIIDMGNNYIFADAPDLSPAIQVVRKTLPTTEHTAQAAVFAKGESITTFRDQLPDKLFAVSMHDQLDTGWRLTSNASRLIAAKLISASNSLLEVARGRIYSGVKTGLNEVFIIDQATRDQLVKEDPTCTNIIKPVLRGEDLRPWYQENEERWLICIPYGWTLQTFSDLNLSETQAWERFQSRHPGLANYLVNFVEAARKRQDKGQYWWELRPCDYYDAFEQAKIFWPDITRKPRFSWGEPGIYIGNTGYCLPTDSQALLGILASRTTWFVIANTSQPLGERAGTLIYRLFSQYMERLPIPSLTNEQSERIGALARQLTGVARERYEARRRTAHRIVSDLGAVGGKLNQRLQEWWQLSFSEFREELVKVFKRDIPLKERDDWEALLRERKVEIGRLTDEIVRLEMLLNSAVYDAFGLDEAERALIERETKYGYGEW